ncbi:MAG TPA: hypothetical protein DCE42_17145 [Myxococcales bacterium]|nr:hypothetical protein [Deltaproteobacteria bacterium]HAA56495.1 hypothetical protein [Myxococcales bacterium]|tara:strand:- start:39386 stop:40444 length:1059 start_codon:yes stop_codon:yes gene_type:complete
MQNKGWKGNFFEDFSIGQRIQCPTPRTITAGDVSQYIAYTGDRSPLFCGPEGWIHPLLTFHSVLAQTVRLISLNARANLGYAGMRWLQPVKVGDTLSVEIEIVGLKENSSKTTGIVYVHNVAKNQRGEEVMTFWRWAMIKKRGEDETPYLASPVIPTLPKQLDASELQLPEATPMSTSATGATWSFEDYEVGERIFHYDGMTINHSDHMSFTRLFQNSAKVHFDAILTDGRPLVYGGLPISLGYAMAFNGLENRLGLCGLNGGTHANPLYAGDTIYAFTDVLDKVALEGKGVGTVRLRLVCVKNEDPTKWDDPMRAIQEEHPKKPGRMRHLPSVILDLDIWDLIPTKDTLSD